MGSITSLGLSLWHNLTFLWSSKAVTITNILEPTEWLWCLQGSMLCNSHWRLKLIHVAKWTTSPYGRNRILMICHNTSECMGRNRILTICHNMSGWIGRNRTPICHSTGWMGRNRTPTVRWGHFIICSNRDTEIHLPYAKKLCPMPLISTMLTFFSILKVPHCND